MKKFATAMCILVFVTFFFAGCEWVGRTAGKAEKGLQTGAEKAEKGLQTGAEKMEKGVNKMQEDTKKGYEEGKQ